MYSMRKLSTIALTIGLIFIMSCSSINVVERVELFELEKKGYSIHLDSNPIELRMTYLNETNISEIKIDKKRKYVNINRKNKGSTFLSIADLLNQKKENTTIDLISVDGLVLDSVMIQRTRFEDGAVLNMRLLTQKDYEGKEFDDLPKIKRTIGNGLLIISTR
jgi:hypothetical protein